MIATYFLYLVILVLVLAVFKTVLKNQKERNEAHLRLQNLNSLYQTVVAHSKHNGAKINMCDQLTKRLIKKAFLSSRELLHFYNLVLDDANGN